MIVPRIQTSYRFYLLSMMSHSYNIFIDGNIGSSDYGKVVSYRLNHICIIHLCVLTTKEKIPGPSNYENQIAVHTSTNTQDGLSIEI